VLRWRWRARPGGWLNWGDTATQRTHPHVKISDSRRPKKRCPVRSPDEGAFGVSVDPLGSRIREQPSLLGRWSVQGWVGVSLVSRKFRADQIFQPNGQTGGRQHCWPGPLFARTSQFHLLRAQGIRVGEAELGGQSGALCATPEAPSALSSSASPDCLRTSFSCGTHQKTPLCSSHARRRR